MAIQFRLKELIAKKEREMGKRLTYEIIYNETGISPNTLSTMATNKIKMVGVSVISRLLDYFDCEPGDLIAKVKPL